jgi:hypothetical protein
MLSTVRDLTIDELEIVSGGSYYIFDLAQLTTDLPPNDLRG